MKGGIRETDHSLITSEDLDIREVIDDAVDAIIEKVLEKGGNVIFLASGSLAKLQRIALVTVADCPSADKDIDKEVKQKCFGL